VNDAAALRIPKGFSFSAVAAGIKASGRLDLALAESVAGTTAAAVFTRNRVAAAPVQVGRAALVKGRGRVRALIVNSGNANCATGAPGIAACERITREVASQLEIPQSSVFPSSTGIIGVPLPAEKIVAKLPELIAGREASEHGLQQFMQAIMTTDTRPKVAAVHFRVGKSEVRLAGVAKGSGMIHPNLATMLVYVFSDVAASPSQVKNLLRQASEGSFNCMSVDGDTSTNDTVLLLASGCSGMSLRSESVRKQFSRALLDVCQSLANQIVADGEGVHHVIRLFVEEAKTRAEALRVAKSIAHSLLVKTAWAGADPNWGRILSTVGACGVPVDPEKVSIQIGGQVVCRKGVAYPFDEQTAHCDLSQPACDVRVRLGRGRAEVVFTTTDLTAEYVRINADYST